MKRILRAIGLTLLVSLTGCAALFRLGVKPPDRFGGPQPGEKAPGFTLTTLAGGSVTLAEEATKRPVVLVMGSYSCPAFRGWAEGIEELQARYGDRVAFYILYTTEAHPKGSASPYRPGREWVTHYNRRENILLQQPETDRQRRRLAARCRSALAIDVPILVDEMDNRMWEAYGSAPNAAYLIGTEGRIIARQGWFHPPSMGRELQTLLSSASN